MAMPNNTEEPPCPETSGPVHGLSWEQVLTWRLARQRVGSGRQGGDPAALARLLCGLHAQVMSSAELAVGVRDPDATPERVQHALWHSATLVKTWSMRGTLHLHAADDLPLYVAASRSRGFHLRPAWLKQNGITAEEAERLVETVPKILAGRRLTREELAGETASALGLPWISEALGSGFGELLKPVAFAGGLCFGPNDGRRITFEHPQDRVGGVWPDMDPDQALGTVLRRFLRSHGPASPGDFARWWGTGVAAARRTGLELGDDLVDVDVEGRRMWVLREDLAELLAWEAGDALRLLPGFDPYIVSAPRDVHHIVPEHQRPRVYRFAGWFSAVVLVGGRRGRLARHEEEGAGAPGRGALRTPPPAPPGRTRHRGTGTGRPDRGRRGGRGLPRRRPGRPLVGRRPWVSATSPRTRA